MEVASDCPKWNKQHLTAGQLFRVTSVPVQEIWLSSQKYAIFSSCQQILASYLLINTIASSAKSSHGPYSFWAKKGHKFNFLRGAPRFQIRSFFEHCSKRLWPPPPFVLNIVVQIFFDGFLKKRVNVCRDIIWQKSAKICAENVKFTLNLWQFYPSKFLFVSILGCQKASRIVKIYNINFYIPPLHNV